jgi:hypothetical protein
MKNEVREFCSETAIFSPNMSCCSDSKTISLTSAETHGCISDPP